MHVTIQCKDNKLTIYLFIYLEIELFDDVPVASIGILLVLHLRTLLHFVVAFLLADSPATIPILLNSGAGESFICRSLLNDL